MKKNQIQNAEEVRTSNTCNQGSQWLHTWNFKWKTWWVRPHGDRGCICRWRIKSVHVLLIHQVKFVTSLMGWIAPPNTASSEEPLQVRKVLPDTRTNTMNASMTLDPHTFPGMKCSYRGTLLPQ